MPRALFLSFCLQISCSSDGSVGLWDPKSGQQLGHFLGHQSAVSAVVAVVRKRWKVTGGIRGRMGAQGAGCIGGTLPKAKGRARVTCLDSVIASGLRVDVGDGGGNIHSIRTTGQDCSPEPLIPIAPESSSLFDVFQILGARPPPSVGGVPLATCVLILCSGAGRTRGVCGPGRDLESVGPWRCGADQHPCPLRTHQPVRSCPGAPPRYSSVSDLLFPKASSLCPAFFLPPDSVFLSYQQDSLAQSSWW